MTKHKTVRMMIWFKVKNACIMELDCDHNHDEISTNCKGGQMDDFHDSVLILKKIER